MKRSLFGWRGRRGLQARVAPLRAPAPVAGAALVGGLDDATRPGQGPVTQETRQGNRGHGHARPTEHCVRPSAGTGMVCGCGQTVFTILTAVVEDTLNTAQTRRIVHSSCGRAEALVTTQPGGRRGARRRAGLAPAPPTPGADDGLPVTGVVPPALREGEGGGLLADDGRPTSALLKRRRRRRRR